MRNHHNGVIGIWRGQEEWGRRKRNKKGGKKRKRGKNSGKVRVTGDEFKWSQANEWGKLNWNNQNEEEFEETDMTDEEICKIGKKDRSIRNAGDNSRGMKSRNKRKWGKREGKEGVEEKNMKIILSIVFSKKMWEDKKKTKWGDAL